MSPYEISPSTAIYQGFFFTAPYSTCMSLKLTLYITFHTLYFLPVLQLYDILMHILLFYISYFQIILQQNSKPDIILKADTKDFFLFTSPSS